MTENSHSSYTNPFQTQLIARAKDQLEQSL